MSASAPILVRFLPRTSWSMSRRAWSTAAAAADPSPGTWLRRCGASTGSAVPVGLAGPSSLVIVIAREPSVRSAPRPSGHAKDPRHPARVPSVFGGGASVALVPPRSSVLPPGAGNEEPKKALKPDKERAKKIEKGGVLGIEVAQRHLDTAAIGRHDDGDTPAAVTLEEVQATPLPLYPQSQRGPRSVARVSVRAQPPQPQRSARSAREHVAASARAPADVATAHFPR